MGGSIKLLLFGQTNVWYGNHEFGVSWSVLAEQKLTISKHAGKANTGFHRALCKVVSGRPYAMRFYQHFILNSSPYGMPFVKLCLVKKKKPLVVIV